MNLKKQYAHISEYFSAAGSNHLTVAKQGNQINEVDQYTVHICYWYAPLRRYYLAAGDLRHCMREYFRYLLNYDSLTRVKLECHQIGFVLGGGN